MTKTFTTISKTLFCFLLLIGSINAQQATIRDCIGAIPVCANTYTENVVPADEGIISDEINGNISCMFGEVLVIWYTFTVNESGKFGFLIEPNNANADYDWSLFNITNASCSDIRNDGSLQVSCNAAGDVNCQGDTGANGGSSYDEQGGGCDNSPPSRTSGETAFNDLIDVVQGNTYVLAVSNWNRVDGGYTIDFSISDDIGIIDVENPLLQGITAVDNCTVSEITLEFNENIKCNTISTENISIEGLAPGSYQINSTVCDNGGLFDNSFVVSFDQPISVSGEYDVTITPTPANAVFDLCDNSTNVVSGSFMVVNNTQAPILLNVEPDDNCQINSVFLRFSEDILCSSVTDGSFSVVGPNGVVSGSLIDNGCMLTDVFEYQFDASIIDDGVYQVFINAVPDFDITNECLVPVEAATLEFQKMVLSGGASITDVNFDALCGVDELTVSFSESLICLSVDGSYFTVTGDDGITREATISTTNCMNDELDEITLVLNATINVDGNFNLVMTTNGIDQVVTSCGTPSESGSAPFSLDLDLEPPTIVNISFPDSCNVQSFSVDFSEMIVCNTAIIEAFSLVYNGEDIPITGYLASDPCQVAASQSTNFMYQLGRTINVDGTYRIDFGNDFGVYTDQCNLPAVSDVFMGELNFNDCDSCFIYVPNAFSPNGDSINDTFSAQSNCTLDNIDLDVYDRWGDLVFSYNGEPRDWDGMFNGETLQPGVYSYVMDIDLREFRRDTTRRRVGSFTIL